jgi:hypothetical protein
MKENLSMAQIDSDKAKVSTLNKSLQDKNKEIELLKKQLEECAREMDKSTAVINSLNKTFDESIILSLYFISNLFNFANQFLLKTQKSIQKAANTMQPSNTNKESFI